MQLYSIHGNSRPHRKWLDVNPLVDPWCFLIRSGAQVQEASGRTWYSDYPVVAFFWPDRFYQVFMLLKENRTEYYCNIIVPPLYDSLTQSVKFVDLDLDVYVAESEYEVLDQDEFVDRQKHYPRYWIENAEMALRQLTSMIERQQGLFSLATSEWWREWVRTR
jgi:protein associated with RNAse G/E